MSSPDQTLFEDAEEISALDLEAARARQLAEGEAVPLARPRNSSRAVLQSVSAKLLIVLCNASTGALVARGLHPAGRGELAALILWPVLLGSALTLGIPSALTYQMRRNPAQQSELVGTAVLISFATGVLGILIGWFGLPHWLHQYSPEVLQYARWFLLSAPLSALALAGRAALESDGNFVASNKLLLAGPLLTVVWLAVLALTHTMTPPRAGLGYVVTGLIPFFWMLRLLWRSFAPSLGGMRTAMRKLFSYGIRSYGVDLCGAMALYIDQALVVSVLSPATMGVYVVALSLSRMLNAFHTSVVMVLFPSAVGLGQAEVCAMTGRAARLSTSMTALAGLTVALAGPQALTLLYGAQYRGALAVLDILIVEVVLAGLTLVLAQAFMALGKPGVVTVLQVLGLALTIPLILVLVPRYGVVGAGIALLLSTTARLTFILISFPLFLKTRPPHIIPRLQDLRTLAEMVQRRLRPATGPVAP